MSAFCFFFLSVFLNLATTSYPVWLPIGCILHAAIWLDHGLKFLHPDWMMCFSPFFLTFVLVELFYQFLINRKFYFQILFKKNVWLYNFYDSLYCTFYIYFILIVHLFAWTWHFTIKWFLLTPQMLYFSSKYILQIDAWKSNKMQLIYSKCILHA